MPEEPGSAASCRVLGVGAHPLLAPQVVGEVPGAELPAENQSLHRQVSPVLCSWKLWVELLGSDVLLLPPGQTPSLHLGPV